MSKKKLRNFYYWIPAFTCGQLLKQSVVNLGQFLEIYVVKNQLLIEATC